MMIIHENTLVYGGSYNDYYVIVLYINYNGIMWRPLVFYSPSIEGIFLPWGAIYL